jgi:hypothetical protein
VGVVELGTPPELESAGFEFEQAGMDWTATAATTPQMARGMTRRTHVAVLAVFATQSSERQFIRGTSEGKGDAYSSGDLLARNS